MLNIPATWAGGIDDLVEEANLWLGALLPAERAQRPKDEVNPRLVRHYTTQGLLPAAVRRGRDARYTRHHLLALLALRRLMADGLSGKALSAALLGRTPTELRELALHGHGSLPGKPHQGPGMDALSYLRHLKGESPPPASPAAAELTEAFAPPPPVPAAPRRGGRSPERKTKGTSRPQPVFRVGLRPGLEVLIAPEFRPPVTEEEWEELAAELRAALVELSR